VIALGEISPTTLGAAERHMPCCHIGQEEGSTMDAARIKQAEKSRPRPARRIDLALALALLRKGVRIYQARQRLVVVTALPLRAAARPRDR
jgi:hypothetical protein